MKICFQSASKLAGTTWASARSARGSRCCPSTSASTSGGGMMAAANDAGDPGTGLEETCRACVWGCCSSVRETRVPWWGVAMRGVEAAEVAVLAFVAAVAEAVVVEEEEEEEVDEEV